jgi:hypothetical protein
MSDELFASIAALAADRNSGASSLAAGALHLLMGDDAQRELVRAAAAVCRAQPTMAAVWNVALAALVDREQPGTLDRFRARLGRAPAALERYALGVLVPDPVRDVRVATLSASGTVLATVRALTRQVKVHISCGEGRPVLEGREMAVGLAAAGATVTLCTDAALGSSIEGADAVLVGADAVGSMTVLNKTGTRMLAAAAASCGVPVYVLATGDKLAMPALWPHLSIRAGAPAEVWESPPPGVQVVNPYFEETRLDHITAVITDRGPLGVDMVPAACAALETVPARRALDELLRAL